MGHLRGSLTELGRIAGMVTILAILTGIGMLGTFGTLVAGMIGVASKSNDPARSNRLMRLRVIWQGITLVLFVLLLLAMQHHSA